MTAPRILVVLLVGVSLVATSCGGFGAPSVEEYSEAVVLNRNRVDFAFGRITRADSAEDFLTRMDEAAIVIGKAGRSSTSSARPTNSSPRRTISPLRSNSSRSISRQPPIRRARPASKG